MHILLISPYFSPAVGGVETHLTDLCRYFEEKKHVVYVRTYQSLGTKEKGKRNEDGTYIHIHRMPWPDYNIIYQLEKYPAAKFVYLFSGIFIDSCFFLLKHRRTINVIQAHGFVAACAGILLGKLFRKRVVINTHVGFHFNKKSFMTRVIKVLLNHADEILVLTTGASSSLRRLGIPEKKIRIYHYWVDQQIFTPKKKKKHGERFVVLFVGRLIEVKGVRTVIALSEKIKNVTFIIAGSGPLANEVAIAAEKSANLQFAGSQRHDDLPMYYNAADILFIPSKIISQEYEEGIPRVMIEALSCGLPVIATPAGGIPDVFSDDIGYLVKDDLASMRQRIAYLSTHRGKLADLAENCRRYAVEKFSLLNAVVIEDSLR